MRRRKGIISGLILGLVILLCGCAASDKAQAVLGDVGPNSTVKGYYTADSVLAGGKEVEQANIRSALITQEGEDTVLTFQFVEGSIRSGTDEVPTTDIPSFTTGYQEGLRRFVLSIDGLSYWDYQLYEEDWQSTMFNGIFKQVPEEGDTTKIYVNIIGDFVYRVETYENELRIYFRSTGSTVQEGWFVTADAYNEYCSGKIPDALGLTPTLCSNGDDVILISKSFSSKEQAEEYSHSIQQEFNKFVPDKSLSILQLTDDQLPGYDDGEQFSNLLKIPIGFLDGKEVAGAPLIKGGRFLAWNHSGTAYSYVVTSQTADDTQDTSSYDRIVTTDTQAGQTAFMSDMMFTSVLDGAFSADDRYFALTEQTSESRTLQVIDTQTGDVYYPNEKGMGTDTSAFVWSEQGDILYAVAGDDNARSLYSYDIASDKVGSLSKQVSTDGSIGIYQDSLYFPRTDSQTGISEIDSINLSNGQIVQVTKGYDLRISSAGIMAVLESDEDGTSVDFKIRDLSTGEENILLSRVLVSDFLWSTNGRYLYYSVYADVDNISAAYPYQLYRYDRQQSHSQYIMDTIAGVLYPSVDSEDVLLMYIHNYNGKVIPFTYTISAGETEQ